MRPRSEPGAQRRDNRKRVTAEGSAKAGASAVDSRTIPYTDRSVWELIFMMVILKIPIAYLCFVVYWAVKAEPKPPDTVRAASQADGPDPKAPWSPRSRRPRPRRGPDRGPARARRPAVTR
jgi:hypothetical protein